MTEQTPDTSPTGVPDPVQPVDPSAVDGQPTDPNAPQAPAVQPVDPSHVDGEPTAPAEEQPNADVAGGDAFPVDPSAVDGQPTDPNAPQAPAVQPVDPSHVDGEPTAPAEEQPNADVAGGDAFPQGGQTDVGTA